MREALLDEIELTSAGGTAGPHPPALVQSVLVGPSTGGERNTIRENLSPIACLRLDHVRFEFDSSFPGLQLSAEMKLLHALRRRRTGALASIFGHADPIGDENYNIKLSGRRAQSIYALLTRRTDIWEDLYSHDLPNGGDAWGLRTTQMALASLGYYEGPADGVKNSATTEAVKNFQRNHAGHGLTPDGAPGPKTRAALYEAYMDLICVTDDDVPFKMDPAVDFLGRGADRGGKADYQGCGEFNPALVFSRAESERYAASTDKTERNKENEPNRRVLIFLFRPNAAPDFARWPCPRVGEEGAAGSCRKRFWSDAESRRECGAERRTYKISRDTFACRFYDRLSYFSPCEATSGKLRLWLHDDRGQRMPQGTPYRITVGSQVRADRLRHEGLLIESDLVGGDVCTVEWGEHAPGADRKQIDPKDELLRGKVIADHPDHPYFRESSDQPPEDFFPYRAEVQLDTDHALAEDESHAARRLYNMGYPRGESLDDNLSTFDADYALELASREERLSVLRDYHRDGTEMPVDEAAAEERAGEDVELTVEGWPVPPCELYGADDAAAPGGDDE